MAEKKSTAAAANGQLALFAAVPLSLIRRLLNLDAIASQVFLALAMRADFNSLDCYPSVGTIAKDTGHHPDTVRAAIKALEGIGAVSVERRLRENGTHDVNRYVVALVPAPEGVPDSQGVPVLESQGVGVPAPQGQERPPVERPPVERPPSARSARCARFVPPTVDEVAAYCRDRGNDIDAEHFFSYYAARGWKLTSNQAMKDWRSAVITWEKRAKERAKTNGENGKPRTYGRFDPSLEGDD